MLKSEDYIRKIEESTGLELGDREWLLELSRKHHQGWNTPRIIETKLIEEFGENLPYIDSGIILDAGCSRGLVSIEIAQYYQGCRVIGIDCEKHRIQENPDDLQIEYVVGDFYRLHQYFPREYFIAIFVMCNLTHVADDLSLLEHVLIAENFHQALMNDGFLCISGGGSDSGIVLKKKR